MTVTRMRRRTRKQQGGNFGPYLLQRKKAAPKRRKTRKRQKGGILPFLIPALIAAEKAAALGAVGGAAGYGVKKGLSAIKK